MLLIDNGPWTSAGELMLAAIAARRRCCDAPVTRLWVENHPDAEIEHGLSRGLAICSMGICWLRRAGKSKILSFCFPAEIPESGSLGPEVAGDGSEEDEVVDGSRRH